jgi:hypothetical protein
MPDCPTAIELRRAKGHPSSIIDAVKELANPVLCSAFSVFPAAGRSVLEFGGQKTHFSADMHDENRTFLGNYGVGSLKLLHYYSLLMGSTDCIHRNSWVTSSVRPSYLSFPASPNTSFRPDNKKSTATYHIPCEQGIPSPPPKPPQRSTMHPTTSTSRHACNVRPASITSTIHPT